jgi:hypothetical protein
MAHEAMLSHVPVPASNVHRICGEAPLPEVALRGRRRLVVTSRGTRGKSSRISLGVPVFNHATCSAFLVAGRAKAQAVWAALRGPHEPMACPAQLIAPVAGRVFWMLDGDAAWMLERDMAGSDRLSGPDCGNCLDDRPASVGRRP